MELSGLALISLSKEENIPYDKQKHHFIVNKGFSPDQIIGATFIDNGKKVEDSLMVRFNHSKEIIALLNEAKIHGQESVWFLFQKPLEFLTKYSAVELNYYPPTAQKLPEKYTQLENGMRVAVKFDSKNPNAYLYCIGKENTEWENHYTYDMAYNLIRKNSERGK